MSKKENHNLNDEEKNEIKNDVKDAIGKAFSNPKTSIDQILKGGPKETLNQEEIDKIVNKKNKNTDKKPVILTIILIILIAIAGVFMYLSNNPKTILIKTIDKTFNTLEKNITPKYEKTKGNLIVTLKGKYNNQTSSNLKINADYQIDTKEKLFNTDINLNLNKNQPLNVKLHGENDKTYLYAKNILDKYLELDTNINTQEETKIVLKSLNNAITKSIENEKFSGSKIQTKINKNMVKTYKSSFTLNKDNRETILDNIKDLLLKDENFIEAYSKMTNITKEETKTEVINQISKIKNHLDNTEDLTINVYTKGAIQEFVKLEVVQKTNNKSNIMSITKIDTNKFEYVIDNQIKNSKITGNIEYKNKQNSTNLKIIINNGSTNLTIALNNKYEKTKKIELTKASDTLKFSDLTDEEKLNLFTRVIFPS